VKVAVAGASGFVGSALLPRLREAGHEVVRLVRRPARSPWEVSWDPAAGTVDATALAGVDAVVNLAGAGIGDKRWTESYKAELYDSHVGSARAIAEAAAALDPPPSVLVSVGAMGYYGHNNGGGRLTEDAPAGTDHAARIVADKEEATEPARAAGIRVVTPRLGLVMDSSGSTLGRRLLPLAKAGLLGPLAGGDSVWPVVSLDDVVRAIIFLLEHDDTEGPYNVAAPDTTTNAEFTRVLTDAVRRPGILPVPRFGLRLVLGELADDVVASFDLDSSRLEQAGFRFQDRDVDAVVATALAES
jgi:uncharacterized protein (TIGR01777 family)